MTRIMLFDRKNKAFLPLKSSLTLTVETGLRIAVEVKANFNALLFVDLRGFAGAGSA